MTQIQTKPEQPDRIAPETPYFAVHEESDALHVSGEGYSLRISKVQPVIELSLNGRNITSLMVDSALDTVEAFDENTVLEAPRFYREPEGLIVTWEGHSDLWSSKQFELRAWSDGFSYGYSVAGQGALDRAHFFRTAIKASPAHAVRLFNPEPNSGSVQYSAEHCEPGKKCSMCYPEPANDRPAFAGPEDFMTISVGRDKEYHDGNWFFTPAPFCYAVEGNGNWLTFGSAAARGEWNFSEMEYPGQGFGFSLAYEGHVEVKDSWQSPLMLCLVAKDEYEAIERYCDGLREVNLVPDQGRAAQQDWWREPIFCGWGEQVSQEVHAGLPKAAERATQANYESWLAALESNQINPGIVVLDDKWQKSYGLNDVDKLKWPDLPGFINSQHARGRHVLLWLKAWDTEGLPPEECILDQDSKPIGVDPGNPAFRQRLAAQVRYMLLDLGADGFKIDFTHLTPRGPLVDYKASLEARNAAAPAVVDFYNRKGCKASQGGHWGLELLRQWLEIIAGAVKAAKPEALIIAHTANPYLADLVDMLRLNDIAGKEDKQATIVPDMWHRARIARAASPFWLLDSDNWPCSTLEQWHDYIQAQSSGEFGVPSLYHATRLAWGAVDEALKPEDYAAIRECWETYRRSLRQAPALITG